jgi:hypothetical protein
MLAGGEFDIDNIHIDDSSEHQLTYTAVISPPIILGGSSGVNFGDEIYQYLVSTSLITSGLLSAMQMARFHVYGTKYYIGTGLLSVVGTYSSSPSANKFHHNSLNSIHISTTQHLTLSPYRNILLHHHRRHRRLLSNV